MNNYRDIGSERGFECPYNVGIMRVNESLYDIDIVKVHRNVGTEIGLAHPYDVDTVRLYESL